MREFDVVAGGYEWCIVDKESSETVFTIDGDNIGERVYECATDDELRDFCSELVNAANEIPTLSDDECELAAEALFEAWKSHYSIHPLSIDEFMTYLSEEFSIDKDGMNIIRNTLDYFYAHYGDMNLDIPEMCCVLEVMFDKTGITADELQRINWDGEE